ncbi:probable clathrin assembly protein At4g32285 [Miscanthus floridulus]|uniref:probable clathrin assembly protein At4g32285 n=1 Tax=Miscanthus floridulus TaxID=154761 RepID=UPI00345894A7
MRRWGGLVGRRWPHLAARGARGAASPDGIGGGSWRGGAASPDGARCSPRRGELAHRSTDQNRAANWAWRPPQATVPVVQRPTRPTAREAAAVTTMWLAIPEPVVEKAPLPPKIEYCLVKLCSNHPNRRSTESSSRPAPGPAAAISIRKALGAIKDQATIGIARVTGAVAPDLDVAIVRATSHDDVTPDDCHAREVLRLASATGAAPACVASIAHRLFKTRDYVIAAKCLALLHRLAAAAADLDPAKDADGEGRTRFLHELLYPTLTGRRTGEPMLALLLDFRDEAHTASWDHSAFVRAYTTYLLDRVHFLVLLLPAPRFADDRVRGPPHTAAAAAADMDTEALLGYAHHLQHLLDRLLACRPAGSAGASRVVRAALHPLLRDSFRVYEDVALVLVLLLDHFFDMDYPECTKAFETYVGTAKQIDALRTFYAWCDDVGVARSSDIPDVRRVDDKLLETMEQFLRQRGRAGCASPPQSARESAVGKTGVKLKCIQKSRGNFA